MAEEWNALYYFKDVASSQINAITYSDSKDLWHQRLRHPSDSAIRFPSHVSNSKNNDPCDNVFEPNKLVNHFLLLTIKPLLFSL